MKPQGKLMQIVRFKTNLSEEDLLRVAKEREPMFKAITGILQKYYIKLGDNEFGGVYIWDSKVSFDDYKKSELAATIAEAYQVKGHPEVEIMEILFNLRE